MTVIGIVEIAFVIIMVLSGILVLNFGGIARTNSFLNRAELNPDEFFHQYYESSGLPKELVIEILNYIAIELSIPATLLRPTDRFTEELEPKGLFYDNAFDGLILDLYSLIDEKGSNHRIDDVKNIDDYIRRVIEHRQMESVTNNAPNAKNEN